MTCTNMAAAATDDLPCGSALIIDGIEHVPAPPSREGVDPTRARTPLGAAPY